MANTNTYENEGIQRPVAAVSSTSSLDSFSINTSQPQHPVGSNTTSFHSSIVQDPAPASQSLLASSNVSYVSDSSLPVANPLAVHNPILESNQPAPLVPAPILPSEVSSNTSSGTTSHTIPANNGVAEFLYQLSKMLTDDNREVIEWSNSKIEVHNPHRLASEVLHKYFRHSKFASFQRQLNYFGFRKLAGKGKMAPCSYVNDAASSELKSLLLIKRKTTPVTARDKGSKKRELPQSTAETTAPAAAAPQVNPVLAGILQRSTNEPDVKRINATKVATTGKGIKHQLNGFLKSPSGISGAPVNNSHVALARSAVGKGIRHGYSSVPAMLLAPAPVVIDASSSTSTKVEPVQAPPPPPANFTFQDPHQLGMDVQTSLSELSNNFKNSLRDAPLDTQCFGMLSRDSSLVDLAMLDPVEPTPVCEMQGTPDSHFLSFVDFPHSSQEFDVSHLEA